MLLISAQDIVTYQGETSTDKSENMKDIFTLSCCACSIATNMNQIQDSPLPPPKKATMTVKSLSWKDWNDGKFLLILTHI